MRAGKTHRELFADWFQSMFHMPLAELIATSPDSKFAPVLFNQMMRDIRSNGGQEGGAMTQACYAMGYNLAIEYMAAYEKTWMLDTFREMSAAYMTAQGRAVDWVFLEVRPFRNSCMRGCVVLADAGPATPPCCMQLAGLSARCDESNVCTTQGRMATQCCTQRACVAAR